MKELRIAPDSPKRMLVSLLTDGVLSKQDRIDPGSSKARRGLLQSLGVSVDDAQLLAWLEATRVAASAQSFRVPEGAAQHVEAYRVRPIAAPASTARVCQKEAHVFLTEELQSVPNDHVVEWTGAEALCCLDIDYHESKPPSRQWLSTLMLTRIVPRPCAWHLSRGGGLHAFYVAAQPFAADELAAVAALRFRLCDASAGLELKTVVRGPGAEAVTLLAEPDSGGVALTDWFGTAGTEETERDEWLEQHGMELGRRYDHTKCPIAGTDEPSKGDPVQVGEDGIFCHRCAGIGTSLGCRRPGFAPWPSLLGAPSSGDLGVMVRGLCHWGHASWILRERYGLPDSLARLAYRAALKARHGDTPKEGLIDLAFSRDTEDYARSGDSWYSIAKSHAYTKDIAPVIARMPAACVMGDDGPRVNAAAQCDMLQAKDLRDRGYPSIERVHGFKIAGVHLPAEACRVAVPNPALDKRFVPRYVLKTKRMPDEEAWSIIETIVPRLDRTLIKACLCAFGSAQETKAGMLPFLFVSGPAGAAKTSTVKLAAAIYGTRTTEAVFDADTTRFRQALYEGANKGPVILVNELLKDAGRSRGRLSAREALDPLSNLTADSSSWVAYRGPVSFGRIPAVVVTEPVCPMALRDETQLARRIRHHHVDGRKDEWKRTLAAVRLADMHLLRTVSTQVNAACDAILSSVCDEFFSLPLTWDEQADTLGVRTIEEDPTFEDLTPHLLEFFRLVCDAPVLEGRDAKRYGRGYKKVSRAEGQDEGDLASVYSLFADGSGADWLASRRLTEKDWSAILHSEQVIFDCKSDGSSVFVRFRTGRDHRNPDKVNEEIRCSSTICTPLSVPPL